MQTLHELTELLRELPGIGPRQARRLALWLARRDASWVERLARALTTARKSASTCTLCMRLYEASERDHGLCNICSNASRTDNLLLVVERDVDLENIERTGTYQGLYFVLGGTTSPLDKEPERRVRVRDLERRLTNTEHKVEELIFALSATTEGEDTETYLRDRLQTTLGSTVITVSVLGRGLSTGTELEYVDADTMKNALQGRHG